MSISLMEEVAAGLRAAMGKLNIKSIFMLVTFPSSYGIINREKRHAVKSLTIATSGLNEERNIDTFLNDVLKQVIPKGIRLDSILFISDGSTDGTSKILSEAAKKNKVIMPIIHKENEGKSARLNQIFREVDTDYLVLLDADIRIPSKKSIQQIVEQLEKYSLVSGNPIMDNPVNRFQEVMQVSDYLQLFIKRHPSYSDSVYTCHGRIIGLRKDIYKQIKVPQRAVGNDAFIYFTNKVKNGTYKWIEGAEVRYTMPKNRKDFLKQKNRFNDSTINHAENFPELDIDKEYRINPLDKIRALLSAIKNFGPAKTAEYSLTKILPSRTKQKASGGWAVSESTK